MRPSVANRGHAKTFEYCGAHKTILLVSTLWKPQRRNSAPQACPNKFPKPTAPHYIPPSGNTAGSFFFSRKYKKKKLGHTGRTKKNSPRLSSHIPGEFIPRVSSVCAAASAKLKNHNGAPNEPEKEFGGPVTAAKARSRTRKRGFLVLLFVFFVARRPRCDEAEGPQGSKREKRKNCRSIIQKSDTPLDNLGDCVIRE